MLGPLVKAQLVALLTKKLLDSPTFVKGVENLHGTFSNATEKAYDTLYQATIEAEKNDPSKPTPKPLAQDESRPTPDQPIKVQNDELRRLIEKTKRDLAKRS
ncbi:BZ3500_MvSof-1268-A1-R1_Chr5-3g08177 [Microbotryum saponariae]|uniref:BZ3500_MvSof-1268-A1-R1_Chr5-3g08177 protein n=1 Tax=Microbotryum saponariae TaxID=289078 RepID=A0A2X0NNZ9_9BASI|nr:BZ3500_MvSof-1268-A1-R1_Chr5-3g08177 [Microbotryum saponariae]SDA07936.1 BZ3501_MvSof-1269-A2-R1_Chr5-1g07321 [Microbotryum saponariae]